MRCKYKKCSSAFDMILNIKAGAVSAFALKYKRRKGECR